MHVLVLLMAMGINDYVNHLVRELGRPGVVYARVFPNGYEVLRHVDDVDSWLRENELNRIAWDPASYCDKLVDEAWKHVVDALKAADIHPGLYDGGQDYSGGR